MNQKTYYSNLKARFLSQALWSHKEANKKHLQTSYCRIRLKIAIMALASLLGLMNLSMRILKNFQVSTKKLLLLQ